MFRVAGGYAVVGWLLIEGASQVLPFFHIPDWSVRLLVLLMLAGFPIALVLAWAFDVTPEGIRRTDEQGEPVLRRARGTLVVGIVGLALAVLAGIGYWAWPRGGSGGVDQDQSGVPVPASKGGLSPPSMPTNLQAASAGTISVPAKSIAVLPFENLSSDKNNAYFADGMQDLILTKLADIGELKVIARTSTAKYASHPEDLKTIGRELGVATILEGSVQKAGDQVLINVQLIHAADRSHIWAQSYTRTLKDVFGVEGEVAGKIASTLKAKLSPAETVRLASDLSHDSAANDLFFKAEYQTPTGRKPLSALRT